MTECLCLRRCRTGRRLLQHHRIGSPFGEVEKKGGVNDEGAQKGRAGLLAISAVHEYRRKSMYEYHIQPSGIWSKVIRNPPKYSKVATYTGKTALAPSNEGTAAANKYARATPVIVDISEHEAGVIRYVQKVNSALPTPQLTVKYQEYPKGPLQSSSPKYCDRKHHSGEDC